MPVMLDEIRQQPEAVARVLCSERAKVLELAQRIRRYPPSQVIIGGRATSAHAGLYGKYCLEYLCGLPAACASLCMFTIYRRVPRIEDALVIGVSQSGEATDVIEMLQAARRVGALTLAITNEANSSLTGIAEYTLLLQAGREKSLPATKTYTTSMAALLMLAVAIRGASGLDALEELPPAMQQTLKLEDTIAQQVKPYRYAPLVVTLGRGPNLATAREAALKIQETCLLPTQAWSPAEFQHGPMALVEPGLPVLAFPLSGKTYPLFHVLLRRLRKEGVELIVVSDKQQALDAASTAIPLPVSLPELTAPLAAILPAQLFACHLALARGLSPDQPRNLTKVTRTR